MFDAISVAMNDLGGDDSKIVLYDSVKNEKMDMTVWNRWFYVKKCKREEGASGILVSEKTQSDTNVCLVLAVGDGCGKYHELTDADMQIGLQSQIELIVQPGDKILAPDDHGWGIKRSPYGKDEYFIHECVAVAKLEE